MPSVPDNDKDRVERLVVELEAIELWDADFWRKRDPQVYEMTAFVGRRKRRAEILSQILTLIPRLDIYARGHRCSSRKSSQRTGQEFDKWELKWVAQYGAVPIRGNKFAPFSQHVRHNRR
jgi:hypothetical protein